MLAIVHAELVMHDHLIPNGVILCDQGKIVAFGKEKDVSIPDGCEILDAQDQFVGPGFIDIHTHDGDGKHFFDDPIHCAKHYLKHGTTTVLPALYFNLNREKYLAAIENIKNAMQTKDGRNIGGFYMEGPYLNPKFGAEKENCPWKASINKNDYQPIIDCAGALAKVWCVAPEREGIVDFMLDCRRVNPSACFSVAHSEASPQQIEALIPYGLRIATHHTNATGDRPRYSETRGVCVDECVNYNREIYAELICDRLGIHVDPYMQRLVRQIKGNDRLILISDCYCGGGPIPKGYEEATDINFDMAGEISGSNLTLEVASRNIMIHTGASVVDVFNYGAYNPAKAVGFDDRGQIAVGKRADLVVVDAKMNIKNVIIEGDICK